MRETSHPLVGISLPAWGVRHRLRQAWSWLKLLATLFKVRVVFLLWVAALGGAFLAARGLPDPKALLLLTFSGTLSAAGASAINQYLERERDLHMARTRGRPLPAGLIAALALLTALGAIIYIGIYTLWLKPRTALNIVIGGAAGSCAVLSGGAAAHAWSDPGALTLALLVFLWTPLHFWSLALAYRDDYARAGFPMLPLVVTPKRAAFWIALHTLAVALVALALSAHPSLGWLYLLPAALATWRLMTLTLGLLRSPERRQALALFVYSNIYLGWLLLSLILISAWR